MSLSFSSPFSFPSCKSNQRKTPLPIRYCVVQERDEDDRLLTRGGNSRFKVIVPAIVQSIVSGQKLPVYGGALRALTPDMIEVTLDTSLDTPLPATIKPMDLSLYNKNDNGDFYPFLELPLPQQHVYHKTGVHVDKAHVKVENHKELVKWFHTVFDEATCKVSVKAKPDVRLGALKYHPKLDKTIDIPALDYLKGFGVIDIGFMLSDNNTGPNMKGQLNLPNAGALTLGLGNITFNLMSGDVKLGLVNVYDVELKPGNNTNNFDGYLYFNELVPNLSAILDSQKGALSQGVVEFNATGNATVVNGQHIKFVEEVLVSKHLTFTYPVVSLLGSVLSGVLDGDNKNNLLDIFGDVVGNSTLLDGIMGHWDDNAPHHNNTSTRKKMKRTAPKSAFMWSMLKLGAKAKAKRA